jgi:DNA-binding IclR family transcriptional regulator
MAVVAEARDGHLQLLGPLEETMRRAFAAVSENGPAAANEVAAHLDMPAEATRLVLNELLQRRLVQQEAGSYRPLSAL